MTYRFSGSWVIAVAVAVSACQSPDQPEMVTAPTEPPAASAQAEEGASAASPAASAHVEDGATAAPPAASAQMEETAGGPTKSTDIAATTEGNGSKSETINVSEMDTASPTANKADLVFLDLTMFDDNLSREMDQDRDEITVNVPAAFSLNEIPERIDRWLAKVNETEGLVQAEAGLDPEAAPSPEEMAGDEFQAQGVLTALIEVATESYKAFEESEKLEPAEKYNALIEYNPENGKANRLIFYKR